MNKNGISLVSVMIGMSVMLAAAWLLSSVFTNFVGGSKKLDRGLEAEQVLVAEMGRLLEKSYTEIKQYCDSALSTNPCLSNDELVESALSGSAKTCIDFDSCEEKIPNKLHEVAMSVYFKDPTQKQKYLKKTIKMRKSR